MQKLLLILIASLILGVAAHAQSNNVGIGTITPNSGAQLDVTATNRGFLPPRVNLSGSNVWGLSGTPTNGMMVFNIAPAGSDTSVVFTGLYVWENGKWNHLAYIEHKAAFVLGVYCHKDETGAYQEARPMNATNTLPFNVVVNTTGGYSVTSDTVNGVSFASSGTFTSTGSQTITLIASGTPLHYGRYHYSIHLGAQLCAFSVKYTHAISSNCSLITNALPTQLVNGQSYSGTITAPYSSGNGGTYLSDTVTNEGLKITRPAGTYAVAGGTIVYTLSGTFTGATGGNIAFELPGSGCVIHGGSVIYDTRYAVNCSGSPTGKFQMGLPMSASNTNRIHVGVLSGGSYIIKTDTVNGVSFADSGIFTTSGYGVQVNLHASGTPAAAGTFNYKVKLANGDSCSFSVTYEPIAQFNCAGAVFTQTPAGRLNPGPYSGTYTVSYTNGNGQPYVAYGQGSNGLLLYAPAGTYAPGGGTITYTLSGTYSGPANGQAIFYSTLCDNVVAGDPLRYALAAGGCASCASYDAKPVNSWVQITAAEYAQLANPANVTGAGKRMLSDALMVPVNTTYKISTTHSSSGPDITPIPASSYVIAYRVISASTTGSPISSWAYIQPKINTTGSSVNGPYVNYGTVTPTYSSVSGTNYYWVIKRPTLKTYPGGPSYMAEAGFTTNIGCKTSGGPSGNMAYYSQGFQSTNVSTPVGNGSYGTVQVISTTNKQW